NRGYTLHSTYVISLLALVHHLTWWLINMIRGEKLIYYPFDLIIAISALSIMYSHHYIQALRDKTLLAEQLQRNIEQRDDFLANTSHELRNPLHSIVNIAEVILNREQLTLSKRSIHDLQNILTVGQRLTLLLNEMLDEMSLKGTVRIHQTSFSLHKLATGVQDLLSYMRRDKDVVIINNIDQSFPPVWGDENRTIQILYNLMHNA